MLSCENCDLTATRTLSTSTESARATVSPPDVFASSFPKLVATMPLMAATATMPATTHFHFFLGAGSSSTCTEISSSFLAFCWGFSLDTSTSTTVTSSGSPGITTGSGGATSPKFSLRYLRTASTFCGRAFLAYCIIHFTRRCIASLTGTAYGGSPSSITTEGEGGDRCVSSA